MRSISIAIVLALAVGCGGGQKTEEQARAEVFEKAESASGPSAARTSSSSRPGRARTSPWSAPSTTSTSSTGSSGSPAGLKVYLPHFDKFMEGDDWFKYIGKRCWAKGRLTRILRISRDIAAPAWS
jgi:hypothetical protein